MKRLKPFGFNIRYFSVSLLRSIHTVESLRFTTRAGTRNLQFGSFPNWQEVLASAAINLGLTLHMPAK